MDDVIDVIDACSGLLLGKVNSLAEVQSQIVLTEGCWIPSSQKKGQDNQNSRIARWDAIDIQTGKEVDKNNNSQAALKSLHLIAYDRQGLMIPTEISSGKNNTSSSSSSSLKGKKRPQAAVKLTDQVF